MAIRGASPRDEYVRRAARFCRDEFGGTFRALPCASALTEAPSADVATARLLCVALGETGEEILECAQLSKDLNFAQASAPDSIIRRRFGSSAVDGARIVVGRATEALKDFVPPEGRVIAPAFPTGAPPAPVPTAAMPTLVPTAPRPPPTPFSLAVLRCLQGANLAPSVLDALIGAVSDVEERLRPEEKLGELCHQVRDALPNHPELEKFRVCLCPDSPPSLLQLLAGA